MSLENYNAHPVELAAIDGFYAGAQALISPWPEGTLEAAVFAMAVRDAADLYHGYFADHSGTELYFASNSVRIM